MSKIDKSKSCCKSILFKERVLEVTSGKEWSKRPLLIIIIMHYFGVEKSPVLSTYTRFIKTQSMTKRNLEYIR